MTRPVEGPDCLYLNWRGHWVTCKRRSCPHCGVRWAKSWETVTRTNLHAYGGPVAMITVTAPGANVLPWSCERDHVHSGARGCRVKADSADTWSKFAPSNWTSLRQAARAATLRATGLKPNVLERVWEPQKRGVPHLHVVVGMATPEERAAAQRFADELWRLAPDYLFGDVDRGRRVPDPACPLRSHPHGVRLERCTCTWKLQSITAKEASRYLSGYLLGRSRHKGTIRENIADERMPRSLIWLTPKLTALTLVTMRRLRYVRWYLAARAGHCSIYPRLFGQAVVDVALALVALEGQWDRSPPDEAELRRRYLVHYRNLCLMRQLQPAYVF